MPITLNNYNFSNVSFEVTEQTAIYDTQQTAVITITPNSGYTVTASGFSLDPAFTDPAVNTVVFTQSGDNVLCTVTFVQGFLMPSENYLVDLCVTGEGIIAPITIDGMYSSVISPNITPTSQNNVVYSNSGSVGEYELLFTKTYTANSGYYLTNPTATVITGVVANYNIVQTPTYDAGGNLTAVQIDVYYTYPNQSISGDFINITVGVKAIFIAPKEITSYNILTTNISRGGELRAFDIFGSPGANFTVTVSESSGNTYTLVNNETLGSSGVFNTSIIFPVIPLGSSSDVIYTITLSGDIQSPFNQPNPIILTQFATTPRITIDAVSSNSITGFVDGSQTGDAFSVPQGLNIESTSTLIVSPSSSDLVYGGTIGINNFVYTQNLGISPVVAANVTNSSTITVANATGIRAGDRFNVLSSVNSSGNQAPFEHEITNVAGNTLTVTPNITATTSNTLSVWRTNGNMIQNPSATITQINNHSLELALIVGVEKFGDGDITFTLQLDEIFNVTNGVFGPYPFSFDGKSVASSCCGFNNNYYLDSNSFATATEIYTDAGGTTLAFPGYYSNATGYRQWNGAAFLNTPLTCPSCATQLSLCYSSTSANALCCQNPTVVIVYVGPNETFTNNSGLYSDSSLTTPAPDGYYSENACNTNQQPLP
jgi:hypothetical protein